MTFMAWLIIYLFSSFISFIAVLFDFKSAGSIIVADLFIIFFMSLIPGIGFMIILTKSVDYLTAKLKIKERISAFLNKQVL